MDVAKLLAAAECLVADLANACRDEHALDFGRLEPVWPYHCRPIRNYNFLEVTKVTHAFTDYHNIIRQDDPGLGPSSLAEMELAVVVDLDCSEPSAPGQHARTDLRERARECELSKTAVGELAVVHLADLVIQNNGPQRAKFAERVVSYLSDGRWENNCSDAIGRSDNFGQSAAEHDPG